MDKDKKSNLHVLVVDDEAESRKTITEYLKTLGYEKFTQAENGAEALRILEHDSSINFIISDWDMPLMDGLTLLQRLRTHPHRAHIPFLVVTSPVSKEMEKVVLAAENLVDSYIIKPFRIQTLEQKIREITSRSVHGPQKQVILADDDEDARQMICEYLTKFGFKEIKEFENGSSALSYVLEQPGKVGLIISDWEMPDLNGLEFLRNCKANRDLQDVPFLMVTSQSSIERMKIMQAAKASVDQYLLKPFTATQIKERIEGLMERFRSRKQVQEILNNAKKNFESGRYKAAREAYEQVLRIDSSNDTALRGLGDVLAKSKGVDAALPHYRKAVEVNPYLPRNYLVLSKAYEQRGFTDKAVSLLKMGIETIGFSADLHFRLGELYFKRDLFSEALAELQKTLELQPDHQAAKQLKKQIQK